MIGPEGRNNVYLLCVDQGHNAFQLNKTVIIQKKKEKQGNRSQKPWKWDLAIPLIGIKVADCPNSHEKVELIHKQTDTHCLAPSAGRHITAQKRPSPSAV